MNHYHYNSRNLWVVTDKNADRFRLNGALLRGEDGICWQKTQLVGQQVSPWQILLLANLTSGLNAFIDSANVKSNSMSCASPGNSNLALGDLIYFWETEIYPWDLHFTFLNKNEIGFENTLTGSGSCCTPEIPLLGPRVNTFTSRVEESPH